MAEEYRESLLKKKYHENCPGCKVDQIKELQRGIPIRQLVSIWIVVLCTALPISSLFSFLYFMIRDFHIAEREEDIAYYAGYVGEFVFTTFFLLVHVFFNHWKYMSLTQSLNIFEGSAFMVGRAFTSVLCGIIADRYGRKPVIIIGTIAVVIFNTLFGLSVNFWMAIVTRFLLGSLNSLLGPIKAYAVEIFREEHQALGLSTVSTSWGIGLIIGPAIGGFLAQQRSIQISFPKIHCLEGNISMLFKYDENPCCKFPYFLPCLAISLFALGVTIATCWLPVFLGRKTSRCFISSR
ncbi:hypothetical protein REPUB_Repub13aG0022200 [Reevesia pubescens]